MQRNQIKQCVDRSFYQQELEKLGIQYKRIELGEVEIRGLISDEKKQSFAKAIEPGGLELVDSQDVVFSENVVDGGAKIGISISGAGAKKRIYFGYNTVRGCSTWGAKVQGEAGKASAMYFYNNTFSGTLKKSPETMYAPQGHGVRFNGSAQDIVLDSNVITSNEGSAIQIAGEGVERLRFVKNTMTKNGSEALDDPAKAGVWAQNVVSGNRRNNIPSNGAGKLPFAMIACEGTAVVGETLTFAVKATGIGPITNVLWDFGDGSPVTSVGATHAFAAAGDYRVTAVAWDAAGQALHCMHSSTRFDDGSAPSKNRRITSGSAASATCASTCCCRCDSPRARSRTTSGRRRRSRSENSAGLALFPTQPSR